MNISGIKSDPTEDQTHLTVHPTTNKINLSLQSSKIPNDQVILRVKNNGNYAQKIISFKRVCAEEIHFDLTKNTFPATEVNQVVGKIDLTNQTSVVSENTRIDVSISNIELAICPSMVYYNGESFDFSLQPLGEGDLEITLKINQKDCDIKEITRKITFSNE